MNSKKIVSIIVLIAGMLLLALIVQTLGDKTYERNEYAKPIDPEKLLTKEEKMALEEELYDMKVNAEWQATKLSVLRRAPAPEPERIRTQKTEIEKSKINLKKAINDSYAVAENAVARTTIPFVQAQAEIRDHKKRIDSILNEWQKSIQSNNPPSTNTVNGYLNSVGNYLEDVQDILEDITPEGSGLTQVEINEYKKEIEYAISEVENTIENLNNVQASLDHAEEMLYVEENVGNQKVIDAQIDKVLESQEEVSEIEEVLENSPIEPPTVTPPSPVIIPIIETGIDPNVKVIPSFDPTKPYLLQD